MDQRGDWPVVTPGELVKAVEAEFAERRRIRDLEARIAALDRDRALLLAYVRLDLMPADPNADRAAWDAYVREWHAARKALIDAGLLAGDDDAAARQEAGE